MLTFGGVGVHCISGEKNPTMRIEIRTNPLPDLMVEKVNAVILQGSILSYLISSPPVAVFVIDLVGAEDLLRSSENEFWGDFRAVGATARIGCHLFQLDVEAHHLIFPGDDHQATALSRVDGASHANISYTR